FAFSLTVDPSNPNVVYLGGGIGLQRIDISQLDDPYTLKAYNNENAAGGVMSATTGPTTVPAGVLLPRYGIINPYTPVGSPATPQAPYYNLFREPTNPFLDPSSLQFVNVVQFNNSGAGAKVTTLDQGLDFSANIRSIFAIPDSVTGGTRLFIGDDQGIYT